jgi:hypothetical protein
MLRKATTGSFPRNRPYLCTAAGPTAMTIAVAGEPRSGPDAAALITRLARLAVNDELVVVYGSAFPGSGMNAYAVLAGLRDCLPRLDLVAIHLRPSPCRWSSRRRRPRLVSPRSCRTCCTRTAS